MKLATLSNGSRDGALAIISEDHLWALPCPEVAATMAYAIENWTACAPRLKVRSVDLNACLARQRIPFDIASVRAPLPRAPQWCDGSAFLNHARLMETAFNTVPIPDLETIPLMYQGASDDFLGPFDPIVLPDEAHGIDFEGEFGVVVGDVPMGCSRAQAQAAILLIVQLNDVSLRSFGPREMRTGFGFVHAKPSTAFAGVAVTPDELGDAWRDCRVRLPLHVQRNGTWFGSPSGAEMNFGFDQLIMHAAATRRLTAGTIIGSGTVSNGDRGVGSACIAERRAIEIIETGSPTTAFLRFGDTVHMEATTANGKQLFGPITQQVKPYLSGRIERDC
ncbi:MAG: fumarylacetoacetate hydrolase family protein [Pseudomonadota bacterium]